MAHAEVEAHGHLRAHAFQHSRSFLDPRLGDVGVHVAAAQKDRRAVQAAGAPLRVLGVARDRDAAVVQRYAQAQGYGFAITQDVAPLAAALAPRNLIPLTAVVGRDGRLVQVVPGEMFEEDVMELLDLARAAPKARS